MTSPLHIAHQYRNGVGHIDQRGESFLVSFYGHRVRQTESATLEAARRAVRELAEADDLAARLHRPGNMFR